MNTPRKMLKEMDKLKFLSHEWSMPAAGLLASITTYFADFFAAIPLLITAVISAIVTIRKARQSERHRDEVHKKVLEMLGEGKDVSGLLKDEE